jgi:GABA(A) receptor-associated protein
MYFFSFKNEFKFEDRLAESKRVLTKYPDRVPIICERSLQAKQDCPVIDKRKYLVPRTYTMGEFLFVIRSRLKLSREKAIFLFVNGDIPATSTLIGEIYHRHKDKDGYLYIFYSQENTFGGND